MAVDHELTTFIVPRSDVSTQQIREAQANSQVVGEAIAGANGRSEEIIHAVDLGALAGKPGKFGIREGVKLYIFHAQRNSAASLWQSSRRDGYGRTGDASTKTDHRMISPGDSATTGYHDPDQRNYPLLPHSPPQSIEKTLSIQPLSREE